MTSASQFVTRPRRLPEKREAVVRADDFEEIFRNFAPLAAESQSSRCSDCGVPFCQTGCPLRQDIPDWLRLTREGRLRDAWDAVSATSAMPEICGRICPQDRLCEGACVLEQAGWETVTIGTVERFLGDTAWTEGWVAPIRPPHERAESIGIVGAGPAGLAAADRLRSLGYAVTIYDRHDRPGGLLIYGIPGFKLEKHVVERRTRRLAEGGVRFELGVDVGRHVRLEALGDRHDAVLLANGVYQARRLTTPGCGSLGVLPAMEYLIASNRVDLGDPVEDDEDGRLNAAGRDVVVVGGGDTAMDCLRTAVRQGARSVTCLYRRDRSNMPGSRREVEHAEEEGVQFDWLAGIKAVLGDSERVAGVRSVRMRLGAPDLAGRRAPEEAPGSAFDRPAQMVIEALGFEPERTLGVDPRLLDTRGQVVVHPRTLMTAIEGVFAAGDTVRGASLVVWAVRDGQVAASAIHDWLQRRTLQDRAA